MSCSPIAKIACEIGPGPGGNDVVFLRFLTLCAVLLGVGCQAKFDAKSSHRSASQEDPAPGEESDESSIEQESSKAAKLTMEGCVDPDLNLVPSSASLTLCNGTQASGKLSIAATDIKSGVTIAGVLGTYAGGLNDCSSDGEINCVSVAAFKAAEISGLADKVISSATVAGESGTVTLPSVNNVLSGSGTYGAGGTALTPSLTLPAAGNVLTGSGAYGSPGSLITPTLTLPTNTFVLAGSGLYGNPSAPVSPQMANRDDWDMVIKTSCEQLRDQLAQVEASVVTDNKTKRRFVIPAPVSEMQQAIYRCFNMKRDDKPYKI